MKVEKPGLARASPPLGEKSLKVKWIKICLNKGEPSSKAKYDI